MNYLTVGRASECELIIQKSRFIGSCRPVTTETEALAVLAGIRKRHWDASHNCYAYRIGGRGETARFSDDGEPSGTAGQPMMEVLTRRQVTNVICVVTRYFGGTLLGAGGLIRAYSKCCAQALGGAGILTMVPCTLTRLTLPYPLWEQARRWLARRGETEFAAFTQQVACEVWIKDEELSAFVAALAEQFGAQVTAETLRKAERPFEMED